MAQKERNNLPGFYDEIPYPRDKKDELISRFDGFAVEVHTNAETEFDYLEDNDYTLIIKNPYHDEDIEIELAGEFSLFFGGWHTHYANYVYDYNQMIETAEKIINNEKCAMVLSLNGEWFGSSLLDHEVSLEEYLADGTYDEYHLQKIHSGNPKLAAHFWKP